MIGLNCDCLSIVGWYYWGGRGDDSNSSYSKGVRGQTVSFDDGKLGSIPCSPHPLDETVHSINYIHLNFFSGFGPRRRNVYYQDSYGRVYRQTPHHMYRRGGNGVRSHFGYISHCYCITCKIVIRPRYVRFVQNCAQEAKLSPVAPPHSHIIPVPNLTHILCMTFYLPLL